eukprot:CAMPEP_0172425140 /NCGR_PEP_ID=MMETSP1064-20121228/30410_1 /TAXON_ID=202472 /ORGANISM="Aulacoseira subarctica , Strain CCAP 1002/5" /LENGTH=699 /DNA_ID=CAMNT_0013167793 /DNA_START=74 /DNA_END=2173 /DNA_ORIENTATION=-
MTKKGAVPCLIFFATATYLSSMSEALVVRPVGVNGSAPDTSSRTCSSTATTNIRNPLAPLIQHWDYSWIKQLSVEDDSKPADNNRVMRQVTNGHYLYVTPTPLRNPRLIAYSIDMASRLGLSENDVKSKEFLNFFSGNIDYKSTKALTWATPYALSIMGARYTSNCPFGNGNGYGDGRAISIGEVLIAASPDVVSDGEDDEIRGNRWEMQLKGAGPTPFCRGADGRAVLRSSIREFLASEAMHHLGISTTRALSLIVSEGGDVSKRPWYSEQSSFTLPDVNDPRLAMYPLEKRQQIVAQLTRQKRDPDTMIEEPNAITCRVSPSFLRVGHVDLFARRAASKTIDSKSKYDTTSQEWKELKEIIWHAAFREFYQEVYVKYKENDDLHGCITEMLRVSADKIATMVAEWLRVGFCQGNFNADNCLVGGRTMDYGPFGFMDEYNPLFAKWTGSGDHFGFLNQPAAGYVNFAVLAESMMLALKQTEKGNTEIIKAEDQILNLARKTFQRKVDEMWSVKMGLDPRNPSRNALWENLEPLLSETRADYTLFWRQLTLVAQKFPIRPTGEISTDYRQMTNTFLGDDPQTFPFYETLDRFQYNSLKEWIQAWREALVKSTLEDFSDSNVAPEERMRLANPKYILREWMLVDAYTKSAKGDDSVVLELLELIKTPYDEGTAEQHKKYYRRAPDESLTSGGTAFMSCSS